MRRGSSFLIALAAAAITFGSLWTFVGPRHFDSYGFRHHYHCSGKNYDSTKEKNETGNY